MNPIGLSTGRVASLGASAPNDVFSQKVGEWAWHVAAPSTTQEKPDIPDGFCAAPIDAPVMDYLDSFVGKNLPLAHLYDSALDRVAAKVQDPIILGLLQQDSDLRAYLRARRIGDVYE